MRISAEIRDALTGGARAPFYFWLLAPASALYSIVMRARAGLYGAGAFKVNTLPKKVISVGGLTAGGVGKTPMVAYLVRRLGEAGHKAAVLTRGYGGTSEGMVKVVSDGKGSFIPPSESGDEAAMLSRALPDTPVVMGSDRYAAGALAVGKFQPDALILDDGYQRMSLGRDLNILLLDAAHPFGNGRTLPMGYLREPVSAINRADIAVLTRADRVGPYILKSNMRAIAGLAPGLPVALAAHRPKSLRQVNNGEETPLSGLAGMRVLAVSGVADPASFALILENLRAKITQSLVYPDHHSYTPSDKCDIQARAKESGAELIVTTEKDAVKLAGLELGGVGLLALGIEMEFIEGEGELIKRLDALFSAG